MGKGGKPKIEVTEYFMSEHFGVCAGPVDEVLAIIIKEKVAWEGSRATEGPIRIEEPELFGGIKKEGGAVGTAYYLPGGDEQILPNQLAEKLGRNSGANCPGYRGLTSIFFVGEELPEPPPPAVYEGWDWEWYFVIDRLGDDYPKGGTPGVQRWTGSTWNNVSGGAISKTKTELGGGRFAYSYKMPPFAHIPVLGSGQEYRGYFDPSVTIPPSGQSNDRIFSVYGRPWNGQQTLLVTEFQSGGRINRTPGFIL